MCVAGFSPGRCNHPRHPPHLPCTRLLQGLWWRWTGFTVQDLQGEIIILRLWRDTDRATEMAVSYIQILLNDKELNLDQTCIGMHRTVILWEQKLILKLVLSLTSQLLAFFFLFVVWQGSVRICLAFKVGSKMYIWLTVPAFYWDITMNLY